MVPGPKCQSASRESRGLKRKESKQKKMRGTSTIYHESLALAALQEIRSSSSTSKVMVFYFNAKYISHKY